MVKHIAFFKRKIGTSVEDFQRHWRTDHAELVIRQGGLRRYVQNHTLASAYHDRDRRQNFVLVTSSPEPNG